MRRGVCVKCGAATVRAAKNGIDTGGRPTTVLRPHLVAGYRGIARNQEAELWAYACTTCGYLELHLLDPRALAFVTEHWVAVQPPPPPAPPPPAPSPA